ncbi:efflux RND transporter periplasmic adaptor subunit [Desulfopila aestuarii]|uniref:Membrane fusion protein, multidrug efflux system n=1 Tax=Desulfopila aestuarii DSM 18488 TaxID=1121416 RepID=A0A1M7YIF3_9BACT|nr:efflux RND transporter periplasmic adaptor subunit [Desulfopila aestuarii]SHO52308.1 membrane fusion protein, multidrug efflux system [Desulfopila aestuarii DSM 18488]
MKKAIFLTILGLVVLVGTLAGIKALQIRAMIDQGKTFVAPPEIVTAASVTARSWETLLTAVGSLEAVQGVTITAEVTGKVVDIAFESGAWVTVGDLLVQQDISVEEAQLRSAESVADLARIDFKRSQKLLAKNVIPQSDIDSAKAQLTQALAQADNIRAVIAKKTIRAPFSGRLGIRQINLGQVINDGQAIVSLQSMDPIYVNFLLPQQLLSKISTGLLVRVTFDALPDQVLTCTITAISPEVDTATRNVRVQATLANPDEKVRAGMYVNVAVVLPAKKEVVTIPATAVLYAPYSDSVFVIEDKKDDKGSVAGKVVRQQFVRLGEKRGDFVVVLSGIKTTESVVSTGAFKLRNGQEVKIDNTLAPQFELAPKPDEN